MRLVLLASALLLMVGYSYAYQTSGTYWSQNDIPVQYETKNSIPNSWENPIYTAGDTWSVPSQDFSYYKTSNVKSEVSTESLDGEGGTLAETSRYTYQDDLNGDTIDKFTIKFDENEDWSTDGSYDAFDVESVAAHELGHALGLKHSSDTEATMYSALAKGETSMRSLEQDDKDGLNAIY